MYAENSHAESIASRWWQMGGTFKRMPNKHSEPDWREADGIVVSTFWFSGLAYLRILFPVHAMQHDSKVQFRFPISSFIRQIRVSCTDCAYVNVDSTPFAEELQTLVVAIFAATQSRGKRAREYERHTW